MKMNSYLFLMKISDFEMLMVISIFAKLFCTIIKKCKIYFKKNYSYDTFMQMFVWKPFHQKYQKCQVGWRIWATTHIQHEAHYCNL